MRRVLVLLLCSSFFQVASCWRQWTWGVNDSSPTARRGHSLVTYDSQLIVFGGRTEDATRTHVPKTYEITRVNGSLEFLSYEDNIAYDSESTEVPVAVYFNDVWSYNINCTSAEVFSDKTMAVYGGFGPMCGDYCDDLWLRKCVDEHYRESRVPHRSEAARRRVLNEIEVECAVTWPPARAGHTSVVFDNAIFVHGGYRTFFPYPTTSSAGAGRGTLGTRNVGFTPYPTHPYYLSDLWKFNISTGGWTRVVADSDAIPEPRTDHSLIVANDVFVLFGGYLSNYYYDDTWQYNASANRWVKQHAFVYPTYPASCTDDLEARRLPHSGNYAAYAPTASLPDNPLNYYLSRKRTTARQRSPC
ncbi:Tip elongation aberrant protein 3 [Phytophthora ramorum]|uniref:Tip elongation aberrant protein 3 n=1 Tax=Phytophthora ramorum TaxID=164328 RepID=UPI0030AF2FD2|nr:Tip elongation aberrant protein 3 [Phytophthora ramorum]